MSNSVQLPSRNGAYVIRTDGSDDARWHRLVADAAAPKPDGLEPTLTPVDESAYYGMDVAQIRQLVSGVEAGAVTFLADAETFAHPDTPVLAVPLRQSDIDDEDDPAVPFRVVPTELWAMEVNLNLSNMDWPDFADCVGPDGVFRGFSDF